MQEFRFNEIAVAFFFVCFDSLAAVQHERKPIVDKKESISATTGATGAGSGTGSAATVSSAAAAAAAAGNAGNASAGVGQSGSGDAASGLGAWRNDYAKAAAAAQQQQQADGVTGASGLSMFPVAFNFAEFTNSLAQRGSELCTRYISETAFLLLSLSRTQMFFVDVH